MVGRTRPRVDTFDTHLINHPYVQVIGNAYLARKPRMITEIFFGSEDRPFGLAYLARVTA
jgi:hypothetical protein